METLLRPMARSEMRLFLTCVVLSVVAHLGIAWLAIGGRGGEGESTAKASRLAERYAQAVNAATEMDAGLQGRIDKALAEVPAGGWDRGMLADTLQWLSDGVGVAVRDSDVVRALDAERSREGRLDVRMWLEWEQERSATDLLVAAYLIGEGTLKSDFGSHRLWVHLEAADGSGRVSMETMDCRLYRAGKLGAADLLHRSRWVEP
ncbi:MAG: hypothetical protein P1P84_21000 [Deferrisomatales bacterium]|nr:hypothetical protein [Deferrisomatales bacterium]